MNLLKVIEKQCQDQPEIIGLVTEKLRESVIKSIVQPESILFQKQIKEMEASAAHAQALLLSKDLDVLKEQNLNEFVKKLILISIQTIFFTNPEILARLKELGIPNKAIRWFTSIEKINTEFQKINESKVIQIRPVRWMYFIHIHLIMNMAEEVYTWAGLTGKKRNSYYNDLHNNFYDLYRTKEYYQKTNKNFKGSDLEMILLPSLDEAANALNSEKEVRKEILQSVQGKTEKNTLTIAFNECSFHFANGQAPYVVSWDLFKLLLPNKNLMDLKTFMLSEQFETYERNYKRYQYYTLKKIIPLSNLNYTL